MQKFTDACVKGDFDKVVDMLTNPQSDEKLTQRDINFGMMMACHEGHINIVDYILTSSNVSIHGDRDYPLLVQRAAQNGQIDMLKYLFESPKLLKSPQVVNTDIFWAFEMKHFDCVIYLICQKNQEKLNLEEIFVHVEKLTLLDWAMKENRDDLVYDMMIFLYNNYLEDFNKKIQDVAFYLFLHSQELFKKLIEECQLNPLSYEFLNNNEITLNI